jgi:hypothetical protein
VGSTDPELLEANFDAVLEREPRYHQPMAQRFEIDPQGTAAGLTTAGQCRAEAVAGGVPALPVGNYIAGYSTKATAILATLGAELTGRVGSGLANTASSVSSTEATETAHQLILSR